VVVTASGSSNTITNVTCPAATPTAVGGGVKGASGKTIGISAPIKGSSLATAGQTPTGWQGVANTAFTVYAICVP